MAQQQPQDYRKKAKMAITPATFRGTLINGILQPNTRQKNGLLFSRVLPIQSDDVASS